MARTKRRTQPAPSWTGEAKDELLAWAECCRRRDGSGRLFKDTIVRHLRTSIGVKLSWDEIDQRIEKLFKNSKTPLANCTSHDWLYMTSGIESMIPCVIVDRTARKLHQRRVIELIDNEFSKPNHHLSAKPTPVRATGPAQDVTPIYEMKNSQRSHRKRARSRKSRKQRRSCTKSAINLEVQESLASPPRDTSSTPDVLMISNLDASGFSQPIEPLTPEIIHSGTHQLAQDAARDQFREVNTLDAGLTNDCLRSVPETYSGQPLTQSGQAHNEHEYEELIASLRHDNLKLRRQLKAVEEERTKVETQLRNQKNAPAIPKQQTFGKSDDCIEEYEQEIATWKAIANNKASLSSFIKNVDKQQTSYDLSFLEEHMDKLHFELEYILIELADQTTFVQQISEIEQPELQILYRRVFGNELKLDQRFSCSYLVRSLTSAALCEWVFERPLQESCTASTPLMETMLSQIITLDGPRAAKALNFSANRALLSGSYFQGEVIPRKARVLAAKMHDLLTSSVHTWFRRASMCADINVLWQQQMQRLLTVFTQALKVKAYTLVSNAIFEVIYPQAGTLIDVHPDKTRIERCAATIPKKGCRVERCIVQLPLAPGLRSQMYERQLVDYNSFRKPGDNSAEEYDLIVRPSILPIIA